LGTAVFIEFYSVIDRIKNIVFISCVAAKARVSICAVIYFGISFVTPVEAQNSYESFGSPSYFTIDRAIILNGLPTSMHTSIYPYRRGDVAEIGAYMLTQPKTEIQEKRLLRVVMDNNEFLTNEVRQYWRHEAAVDSIDYNKQTKEFIIYDSLDQIQYQGALASKKPFLKVLYTTPAHLYELDTKSFYLRVNPMINFSLGKERGDEDFLFVNQRGIEVRGGIDGRVFFYTNIVETQLRPPTQYRWWVDRYKSFPDAGLFKKFESSIVDFDNGYDYLNSEAYVGFNISKHVGVHFGHGKNFIGDGYRSMFISDFATNYFYLKFNTRVWKFHYQNIFAELAAKERPGPSELVPKKYMAAHYLSFQARENLSFGIFEAVIFDRESGQFEFQYLNPIILYRTIEHQLGSPDNVLLGFNFRWDIFKRASFYGQFIFDEFKLEEFFGGNGWWGNKYAFQLGAKYINAFNVDQLDLQVEYNQIRPFTYTHRDSSGSYTQFNQPLAHPMGANLQELIIIGRYRPFDRLELEAKFFIVNTAEDSDTVFYGTNILRSNETRNADFGIEQGQGIAVDNVIMNLTARYELKHNLFIEAKYFNRNYKAEISSSNLRTRYVSIGLRWNLYRDRTEF
jgi:hypothetical protein